MRQFSSMHMILMYHREGAHCWHQHKTDHSFKSMYADLLM